MVRQQNALPLVTVIANHDHVQVPLIGIRDAGGLLALENVIVILESDGELPWRFRRMVVAKHINTMGRLIHLFNNARILQREIYFTPRDLAQDFQTFLPS